MAMASVMNNTINVALESLDERSSGIYLIGDTKVVNITFYNGMISVKEIYDLEYNPKGKCPKALRPIDVAKLYRFVTSDFRYGESSEGYTSMPVLNPGKYGAHRALAVIRKLNVPGGTIEIEEKRFRLDKALCGEYSAPAWLLGSMLFEFGIDPWEDSQFEGYLKKIEVTPIPERTRERRRPIGVLQSRQQNPEFGAENGEPIEIVPAAE